MRVGTNIPDSRTAIETAICLVDDIVTMFRCALISSICSLNTLLSLMQGINLLGQKLHISFCSNGRSDSFKVRFLGSHSLEAGNHALSTFDENSCSKFTFNEMIYRPQRMIFCLFALLHKCCAYNKLVDLYRASKLNCNLIGFKSKLKYLLNSYDTWALYVGNRFMD